MIELSELRDAAQKAFPAGALSPPRDGAWALVAEMGWLMVDLPEAAGGLGLGREAAATLHFEMGRVLGTAPLAPAMLALDLIARSAELADRGSWIERICGGEYVPLHMLGHSLTLAADGTLSGTVRGFFEADMAGHVLASTPAGYLLIPTSGQGAALEERPIWDPSRRLFDLVLTNYQPDPALVVGSGNAVKALHDAGAVSAQLAIAADCLGGANAALDMTVEYLKMRRQFDRPLAMFQALKHRCADLKIAIVAAEALLWARARDDDASVADLGALKAHCADVYRMVVEEAVQLHGGIGLTEEHQCHRFLKRALLNQQLSGNIDLWREAAGRQALARFAA